MNTYKTIKHFNKKMKNYKIYYLNNKIKIYYKKKDIVALKIKKNCKNKNKK